MIRFGDHWSRLRWRSYFAIVGAPLLLIWAVVLQKESDARVFLHTETIIATINNIEIIESDNRFAGKTVTYITQLSLAEGEDIQFMLVQSPPNIGSKVPVLVDKYGDGSQNYRYNQMDWQLP